MRLISGEAKGLRLKPFKGSAVRPTAQVVRGALFAMLESLDIEWSRGLDLFAGTGALGLEALSRGAQFFDFVEKDPRLCQALRESLARAGFENRARVYCTSVEKALPRLPGEYTLVLLDPPYSYPTLEPLLTQLTGSPLVLPQTVISVEHYWRHQLSPYYHSFKLRKSRRFGDTQLSLYGGEA